MKRCLFSVGLALAMPLAAAAAPPPASPTPNPAPASFAEAVEQAWLRLPAAQAQVQREAQTDAHLQAAGRWTPAPPTVSLGSLNDRLNAGTGKQEWELEAATPLWLPGQRRAQQALAQSEQMQLRSQMREQRLELAGQVRSAWWQIAAARAAVDLAQRRLASAEALQADVERRWRAGDLARTEINAARAEVQAAQSEAVQARRDERSAQIAWRVLTGSAAPESLGVEDGGPSPASIDAHPRVVAADAAIASAQAQLRLADRSRREAPELALRFVRERGGNGEPYANAIGLQLSIPLSSGPKVRGEMAGVRAELIEAEVQARLLREQLEIEAQAARQDLEATAQQLQLARTRGQLAADTLRLLQKSFDLGESDLATLLRARADAIGAEADVARLSVEHARATSLLQQALGTLP